MRGWRELVERVRLEPGTPFEADLAAFGDGPAWVPGPEEAAPSNPGRLMTERGFATFADLHRWSVTDREGFWAEVLRALEVPLRTAPERILDPTSSATDPRWLRGARMHATDLCFRADARAPAIVAAEPDGGLRATSYGELDTLTAHVAGGLRAAGFRPGDGVALYMPMTVECVAAYLGVIRAGCHVVAIADSFPARELARRLEIGRARGLVTVDRHVRTGRTLEPYRVACDARAPAAFVIPADGTATPATRLRPGDRTWAELVSGPTADAEPAAPDDTITLLFSSGTTGDPKAIPWTHLTPLKCAMDARYHQDVRPGDVVAWPTNVGWMMGPWLVWATLANRGTIALYPDAPTGPGFVRFVGEAGVRVLGVVPSLVRAWRERGVARDALAGVRVLSSTGEPSNVADSLWLMSRTGYRAPVIEYCGGTEIGGAYVTGSVVQPARPAAFTTPALGIDLVLHDPERGFVDGPGSGEVYLVPPSIGLSQRLVGRDHEAEYHADCPTGPRGETLRRHGDRLVRRADGTYRAQGRTDDTMNLGGIKVGALEIERAAAAHPQVAECAAVGVQPGGEGAERLVLFVRAREDAEPRPDAAALRRELGRQIAAELNPLFKVHDVVLVGELPRTASNKLMRRSLRDRYVAS